MTSKNAGVAYPLTFTVQLLISPLDDGAAGSSTLGSVTATEYPAGHAPPVKSCLTESHVLTTLHLLGWLALVVIEQPA